MMEVAPQKKLIDAALYRQQGYVLIKGLFEKQEVEDIRREVKEIFTSQMLRHGLLEPKTVNEKDFEAAMYKLFEIDLETFANCGKQAQHLISLHKLSLDPRIVERLSELGLTSPNISTRPVLYFNAERLARKEVYWRLSLHQDWRSMQGSLDSVVVWLPLVNINTSLGALEIIPGSHKWGLLDADIVDGYGHLHDAVDESQLMSVEIEVGDALFFSSLLVHRSGTNVTDSIRWSCHFRYNNLHERTFVERGFPHPYLYQPQKELITPAFPDHAQVRNTFAPDEN